MEVLASKKRQDQNTDGLKVYREEFKFKSYADGVVLSIKNPHF